MKKKLASSFETCSLGVTLSDFPIWLEHPQLHRKKGIFTLQEIDSKERKILRTSDWNWIGKKDESTDVGNILIKEKTIVLPEIKNRVDSGGTAGRREIWTSQKFGIIVEYLLQNEKLYEKNNCKFSFQEMLATFGYNKLELYVGVLFDKNDRPATIEYDRKNGFYSSSKEGLTTDD